MIKTDMRAWNKTFSRYLAVRKTVRKDVIHEKARDFAFKAYQFLPPTTRERIDSDMRKNNMLLKITVRRLQAKGVKLKNLGTVKVRFRAKGGKKGGTRLISKADKIIADYAKKLLRSKIRSRGYHRVSFLKLAQLLGKAGAATINPRSTLARTNVKEKHTPSADVYTLNAIARGMDCPSTDVARDKALQAMEQKMKAFIAQRLAQARKQAGFP
jgi:hypothetical protein